MQINNILQNIIYNLFIPSYSFVNLSIYFAKKNQQKK